MTEPTVTTETPACNLCGSERRRELYRAQDYRFRIDDLEWPVVSCEASGLGYLCPPPTLAVIG